MFWLQCLLAFHLWSFAGFLAIVEHESRVNPTEEDNDV